MTTADSIGRQPVIPHGQLGVILLIATETVVFSTFIGAYVVLRNAALTWPPAGTPKLHIGLSLFNSFLLVTSSITAGMARWKMSRSQRAHSRRLLTVTFLLGSLFVLFQAVEFHRLYGMGLTLKTGPYGAIFYTLITCHALHVLGGLAFLGYVLHQLGRPAALRIGERVGYCEIYWHFVTVVWLILFCILYIF